MQGYWNRLKAEWYRRGLEYSTLPATVVPMILERAAGARTFLDAGAGCGALTIPLAREGKRVTALDPSRAMLDILEEDVKKEGLKGVRTIHAAWGEVEVKPHDVIICANVPALLKDDDRFLRDALRLAGKYVFIIAGAGPEADKFYYKDLYPLIFGRPFGPREDYLKTYVMLHGLGVCANVEMIEYDFDQPFDTLEDAVEFWKEYMGLVTDEHDEKLRGYLETRLVKKRKVLLAPFHKKAAVIWWRQEKAGRKR